MVMERQMTQEHQACEFGDEGLERTDAINKGLQIRIRRDQAIWSRFSGQS